MDDRDLEKLLRDILKRLGVTIRVEQLEDGVGGFCKLDQEPIIVLSTSSSRKQRIDIFLGALKRIDTSTVFLPPAIRDLIEEERGHVDISKTSETTKKLTEFSENS